MARTNLVQPTDPRVMELWNQAVTYEKKLRTVLKKKSFYDMEARSLRQELRKTYVELMFADPQFALDAEVEQFLWKSVFYRTIEEFRSKLRSTAASPTDAARQAHAKVLAAFVKFLKDATLFYESLIERFQQLQALRPHSADSTLLPTSSDTTTAPSPKPQQSIHRCLIYLGDLARYYAQILTPSKATPAAPSSAADPAAASSNKADSAEAWRRAATYYKRAAAVCPSSGNPFNQLAVMAYYTNEELRAVYFYYRSLSVAAPFHTARENLIMLFEKNRAKYTALPPAPRPPTATPAALLQDASTRFVRLHGILYDRINAETLPHVRSSAFSALAALLSSPAALDALSKAAPQDHLLLHLAVACVYSAHHHHHRAAAAAARPGPDRAEEVQSATALAWQATCVFIACATTLMTDGSPAHQPTLTALHLLLHWLHLQPNILLPPPTAPPEYVSAYTQFLHALASLPAALQLPSAAATPPTSPSAPTMLPEELDLLGFQPLALATPSPSAPVTVPPATQQPALRASKVLTTCALIHQTLSTSCPLSTDPSLRAALATLAASPHYSTPAAATSHHALNLPTLRPPPAALPAQFYVQPRHQAHSTPAASDTGEEDEDEEVIVFKPRSSRTSTTAASPPESLSAPHFHLLAAFPGTSLPYPACTPPPGLLPHPTLDPSPSLPPLHPPITPAAATALPAAPPPQPQTNSFTSLNKEIASIYSRTASPQLSQPPLVAANPSPLPPSDSRDSWPCPTPAAPAPHAPPSNTSRSSTTHMPEDLTWLSSITAAYFQQPPLQRPSTLPTSAPLGGPHLQQQQPTPAAPWPAALSCEPPSPALAHRNRYQPSIYPPNHADSLPPAAGPVQRPDSAGSDVTIGSAAPGLAADLMRPAPHVAAVGGVGHDDVAAMSVDLPSAADRLRQVLARPACTGSGSTAGRDILDHLNPSPAPPGAPPPQQPQQPQDSSTMFGALFDTRDVFHHVRQGSGQGGVMELPGDALVGGLSRAVSRTATPVDPVVAESSGPSCGGSWVDGGLVHGRWGTVGGPALPAQGLSGSGALGGMSAELPPSRLQPMEMQQPVLPQLHTNQQLPPPRSPAFSFIDLLQEQQQEQQQQQQLLLPESAGYGLGMAGGLLAGRPQYAADPMQRPASVPIHLQHVAHQQQYHQQQPQVLPPYKQAVPEQQSDGQVGGTLGPAGHWFGGLGPEVYSGSTCGAPNAMY